MRRGELRVTGADCIADSIVAHGLSDVFVYPGGTIAPILDALRLRGVRNFCARHEQGAGYAALARARLTQDAQIVMVTSGPGVTNLMTVIADAYFDSTPLVVLTGQVGTGDLRRSPSLRQRGFQEVDSVSMAQPVTKAQFQPMSPEEIPDIMAGAFMEAESGRPGPVLVDLPMDVQRGEVIGHAEIVDHSVSEPPFAEQNTIDTIARWLSESQRPVIIAGQGVHISRAHGVLRRIAAINGGIPVSQSLLGLGSVPTESPLSLGFHGHTGNQCASKAIYEADLLISVGSRLDVRQTGSQVDEFVPGGRVVRIDLDPIELANARVRSDLNVIADARMALESLAERLDALVFPDWTQWRERVADWKSRYALEYSRRDILKPQEVVMGANALTAGREVVVTTGVGAHQQWVARHFDFDFPLRILLTSGGHGAMGFDLPTAIGAQATYPECLVLCFAGDGSFQMNVQELATIAEYDLPVKIIVLDNHRLGMVSQFQNFNWGCDPTCGDKWNPDFAEVARAYGIRAATLETADSIVSTFTEAINHNGPYLVHAVVDSFEDVTPMLLAGQNMAEMWEA